MLHVQQLDSTYHQLFTWHGKFAVEYAKHLFKFVPSASSVAQFGSIRNVLKPMGETKELSYVHVLNLWIVENKNVRVFF